MTVYVGNLNYTVTEAQLRDAVEQFGDCKSVQRVTIPRHDNGQGKGYGFVEFADDSEARAIINTLNNAEWKGRNLHVSEARGRRETRPLFAHEGSAAR